jgi:hypothetical protein
MAQDQTLAGASSLQALAARPHKTAPLLESLVKQVEFIVTVSIAHRHTIVTVD